MDTHAGTRNTGNINKLYQGLVKGILRIDLFTCSNICNKPILLCNDNIGLNQMYHNVFTTCIDITICELLMTHRN